MINVDYFKKEMYDKATSFLTSYANNLKDYKKINFNRLKNNAFLKSKDFIIAEKDKEILGLAHVENQVWDSNHFGLKFAKINLILAKGTYSKRYDIIQRLLERINRLEYDYIILKCDAQDLAVIHSLEKMDYKFLVDSVTLIHDLKKVNEPSHLINIRTCKDKDILILMDLAKNNFIFDRFHADPGLDNKKCDLLHSEWIKNCCNHKLANEVFVAEMDNRIAGFNACKIDKNNTLGSIVLTGVSPDFRKRGIGNALVDAVLVFSKNRNVNLVEVRTELPNIPAINLYQKSGFKLCLIEKYYRKIKKN